MKVLVINSKDGGGGAAGIARTLSDGYAAAGHEVRWLVGLKTRRDDSSVHEIDAIGDIGLLRRWGPWLFQRLGGLRGSPNLARQRWRRLLQSFNPASTLAQLSGREDYHLSGGQRWRERLQWDPDVIHIHNLHGFNHVTHFDLRTLPRVSRETPTVVTLHDAWLATGHCAHFFECKRWQESCGSCPRLGVYPRLLRDGTQGNLARKGELLGSARLHVVGVCDWITQVALRSRMARGAVSTRTIANGINVDRFQPLAPQARRSRRSELGFPEDALVVVYASELGARNPYRDFNAMRESCRELAEHHPGRVFAIELGGDYKSVEQEGRLTRCSLGFVSERSVIDHLQISDVLLHAALADTSPTIVYEGMACGLPVVASDACGLPEQVIHGENGLLSGIGDKASLSRNLRAVALSSEIRVRFAHTSRRRMLDHFDERRMVRDYLDMLESLAGAGSTTAS